MTKSRRLDPIPQLKCVGGTAGRDAFIPQSVQCFNRGSDGSSTQWECKADMPNDFRFGKVQVSCEGYSHRDDPYVLKESCGLEYTIDLTKEGLQKQASNEKSNCTKKDAGSSRKVNEDKLVMMFIILLVCILVLSLCYALYQEYQKRYCQQSNNTENENCKCNRCGHRHQKGQKTRCAGTSKASTTSIKVSTTYCSSYDSCCDKTKPQRRTFSSSSGTRTASGFGGTVRR